MQQTKKIAALLFLCTFFYTYSLSAQEYIIRILSPENKVIALVECEDFNQFNQGFAAIKVDSFWAYYDTKGTPTFYNMQLLYADNFSDNGLALIQTKTGYGFMNKTGKIVVPAIYSSAYSFDFSNIALVEKDNKWGVLDAKGKIIIPVQYEGIQSLGAAIAVIQDSKVAFYSNTGVPITNFDYIGYGASNYDVINIKSDDGWSFLDKQGNISKPQFFGDVGQFSEGLIGFNYGDKIGFVNPKGEIKIPAVFEAGDEFSNGLAAVKKDGLWGYIDSTGTVVIPFMYSAAYKFYNGKANVTKNDTWLVINKNNEVTTADHENGISEKNYTVVKVEANENISLKYPKYNFKVEKTWKNYGGEAYNGKIYLISTGKLLGENVTFANQKITSGTFYKNDKKVELSNPDGIEMKNLLSAIDDQFLYIQEQEKIAAQTKAQLDETKTITQQPQNNTFITGDVFIALYDTLSMKLKQEEDQFTHYLDLSSEFDLDASTEEERIANKEKKIQPYVDLINDIVKRIDYLIANDPKMYPALEQELLENKKAVLKDLGWIQ